MSSMLQGNRVLIEPRGVSASQSFSLPILAPKTSFMCWPTMVWPVIRGFPPRA